MNSEHFLKWAKKTQREAMVRSPFFLLPYFYAVPKP